MTTSGSNQPATPNQISYNQQHTLQTPPNQTSFVVVESDWTTLRTMIARIQNPFKLTETFGGIFLGAVFGPLADVLKFVKANPQSPITSCDSFIWVVVLVASAIICFLIGFAQKQASAQNTELIFDYMDNLEERGGCSLPPRTKTSRLKLTIDFFKSIFQKTSK